MTGPLPWWRTEGADPREDLAFEEDLMAMAGDGQPGLFTYRWDAPTLVLGYGQDLSGIDLGACRALGVRVLRRPSGGTAVLHEGSATLSLALPASHPWAAGVRPLYDRILDPLREVLAAAGFPTTRPAALPTRSRRPSAICFENPGLDGLWWRDRRVAGGAQVRRRLAVLVHVTILTDLDLRRQAAVFGVPQARLRRVLTALPQVALTPLLEQAAQSLAHALGATPADPLPRPLPSAIARRRYQDPHWAVEVDPQPPIPNPLPPLHAPQSPIRNPQ